MGRARRSGLLSLAAIVGLTASLLATPAAAVEVLGTSGTPGMYGVKDTPTRPGVVCRFENHGSKVEEELDRVRARKLRIRGHESFDTWVGYRFRVFERLAPETDYELAFKGALLKRQASASDPARFGARSWSPPEDLPASDFRVIIDLVWYKAGSKSKVRGRVRGVLEVYKHTHPAASSFVEGSPGDGGECFYNFWT
jgi:hypothetical protein